MQGVDEWMGGAVEGSGWHGLDRVPIQHRVVAENLSLNRLQTSTCTQQIIAIETHSQTL